MGLCRRPGGSEEDKSGSFRCGGWVAPYGDEIYDNVVQKELKPDNLSLYKYFFLNVVGRMA